MPGDSVHIDLKLSDLNSHKFSGSSTKENIILAQLNRVFILDKEIRKSLYKLNESNFLSKLDSLENIGKETKEGIRNSYLSKYFDTFLKYKLGELLIEHPIISSAPISDKKIILSQDYHSRYEALFEEEPNLLNIYPYVECLTGHVDKKAGGRINF